MGAVLLAIAALTFALPFATPETVRWIGIRRSERLARGFAVAFAAFGGLLAYLALA